MSRLPLSQNATGQKTGNGGTEPLAAQTVSATETVTYAEEKTAIPEPGQEPDKASSASKETSDREVARFSLNVQAAITAEAAELLEKCAGTIAAESAAGFARADAAIGIALGRVNELAAGLQQLRSELAKMAAGQADSVREMAGALRRTSGA
jgi:hypothetical protein